MRKANQVQNFKNDDAVLSYGTNLEKPNKKQINRALLPLAGENIWTLS